MVPDVCLLRTVNQPLFYQSKLPFPSSVYKFMTCHRLRLLILCKCLLIYYDCYCYCYYYYYYNYVFHRARRQWRCNCWIRPSAEACGYYYKTVIFWPAGSQSWKKNWKNSSSLIRTSGFGSQPTQSRPFRSESCRGHSRSSRSRPTDSSSI